MLMSLAPSRDSQDRATFDRRESAAAARRYDAAESPIMPTPRRSLVLLVLLLTLISGRLLRAALPDHTGAVTDLASVLSPGVEQQLLARLGEVEAKTTAEIAVATVPSLDGLSVEDYGNRLFRQWGIGQKGKDNGVLILVAPSDRKMRIEVGYGLEGVLPDGLAGDIVRTQAIPAFRDGNFEQGIRDTVERVATIVLANHPLTAEERAAVDGSNDRPPSLVTTPFFGLFIVLGFLALGVGFRTKTVFPLIWGGLFGGIPTLMALIPFFNANLWVLAPLAIGMFALGWVKGGSDSWRQSMRGNGHEKSAGGKRGKASRASSRSSSRDDDTWTMGSGSSSSSGSSGSSGSSSSSSFGGGRSGGGGASGSW